MDTDKRVTRPRLAAVNRRQMVMRAIDVERLIDEDHSARAIWELVGRLNLSLYYAEIAAVEGRKRGEKGVRNLSLGDRGSAWCFPTRSSTPLLTKKKVPGTCEKIDFGHVIHNITH